MCSRSPALVCYEVTSVVHSSDNELSFGVGMPWKLQDNEERAHCSVHGKLRSLYCMVANPDGTYVCKADKSCQSADSSGVKNAICKFFAKGSCDRGEDCAFAHSEDEIGMPVTEAALTGAAAAARSKPEQKAMCGSGTTG